MSTIANVIDFLLFIFNILPISIQSYGRFLIEKHLHLIICVILRWFIEKSQFYRYISPLDKQFGNSWESDHILSLG